MTLALGIRTRFLVSVSTGLTLPWIPCTPLSFCSQLALYLLISVPYRSVRSHAAFSRCLTKHPLSFVSRCQHLVPCNVSPLNTTPIKTSAAVIPLTRNSIVGPSNIEGPCSRRRLTLLSKLSTTLAYIGLCYPTSQRVTCAVCCKRGTALQWT